MGKGGAGKTTVAAVLARVLARSGHRVVAVDADPNSNLAIALGPGEKASREPPAGRIAEGRLSDLGVAGPDGVLLLQTGAVDRRVFGGLEAEGRVVVADLRAGVNDLIRTGPRPGDAVLVVTEPYRKSLEVARRAVQVARDLEAGRVLVVANRLEGPGDADEVRHAVPGVYMVQVPEDPAVARAGRLGVSPLDAAPASPAIRAIAALASRLLSDDDASGSRLVSSLPGW